MPSNMFKEFIEALEIEISTGLPGWDAQKRMAPLGRSQSLYRPPNLANTRESGVLIWLYPNHDKIFTRMILRATGGVHSGQVAFPGGQVELEDHDFWSTALREANEEVGLASEKIKRVGALTPLYIPPSNFWVHPFIATSDEPQEASISQAEVQTYFDVDIFDLLESSAKEERLITVSSGAQLITPSYTLQGRTVWGATAMMLSEMEELIRRTLKSF